MKPFLFSENEINEWAYMLLTQGKNPKDIKHFFTDSYYCLQYIKCVGFDEEIYSRITDPFYKNLVDKMINKEEYG